MTRKNKILQVKQELDELRRKVKWLLKEQEDFLEGKKSFESYFKTGEEGAVIRRAEQAAAALDDAIAMMEQTFARLGDAAANQ